MENMGNKRLKFNLRERKNFKKEKIYNKIYIDYNIVKLNENIKLNKTYIKKMINYINKIKIY